MDEIKRSGEAPEKADFAVRLTGQELSPYFRKGEVAYFKKTADFCDGDVGLFLARGKSVIRQYCEDSEGGVYLFAVNRRLRRLDLRLGREESIVSIGKLITEEKIPLPEI